MILGDNNAIRVEQQVFAQVTSVYDFQTCEAEEGVVGLAFAMRSSHGYRSLLSNLLEPASGTAMKHAMYSLYLSERDDYPEIRNNFQEEDLNGNLEYGFQRPISATSQLVFGGVDQSHYEGCLQWHALGQFQDTLTGGKFEGYWDFALENIKFGGTSISTSNLGLVDTGSSYIVGPLESVAQIATMNQASCYNLLHSNDPQEVDCSAEEGFDAAIIDCDQPMFNLEFLADGRTYVLEKEDLVIKVDTNWGEACILRVAGSPGSPVSRSLV